MNSDTRPIRAMIWKETREALKFAMLGMLLVGGAFAFMLWQHRGMDWSQDDYRRQGSPLLEDEFQATTMIAAAAAALLLALWQTLPEKRLDQWAFLVHRPASRTRLFAGKLIAALGLYLLAVAVPYLCAVAWVATPGHVPAPFSTSMMQPGVVDVVAGIMYYFAGLLIGLREARWYGSRVLVIGLALVGTSLAYISPQVWQALLSILIVSAVLATAAWGSFVAGGNYDPQPRVAKTTLGVAVFAGIVLLGALGVAALVQVVLPQPQQGSYEFTSYRILPSGQIVRWTQYFGAGAQSSRVTDPNGNEVPEVAGMTSLELTNLLNDRSREADVWLNTDFLRQGMFNAYRHGSHYYEQVYPSDDTSTRTAWYYLRGERYIVGFNPRSRDVAGYFARDGFYSNPPPMSSRFDASPLAQAGGYNRVDLWFPSGVYRFREKDRKIEARFTPPTGERVVSGSTAFITVQTPNSPGETENKMAFDVFATSSQFHLRGPDGKMIFSAPIEHSKDQYPVLTVVQTKDEKRFIALYSPMHHTPGGMKKIFLTTEFSPTGQVLARHELPPVVPVWVPSASDEMILFGSAAPFGLFAGCRAGNALRLKGGPFEIDPNDPGLNRATTASLVSGLICAMLTLAIGRRHVFSRGSLIGWTVGNFLLGPAGVLTMIALRSWPARELCPSCRNRWRPVNQELCPSCAAPFPAPAMDGTEIFVA